MADGDPKRRIGWEKSRLDDATGRIRVVSEWEQAHGELVELSKRRATLDGEEGPALLRALRSGAHVRLGYASFAEYIERLFGYTPRFTSERLRVAEELEELPELDRALRAGELSWSIVRELSHVATPQTELEWLDSVRGRTARDVEKLVSGHRPGDTPRDPVDPAARSHVLRLELSAETFATFREALAKLRREAGESLDDDAAVLLMARHVLGGPGDDGRASYQVALTVCEQCSRGRQQGRGELFDVVDEVIEMATCDAQHIGHTDTHVGTQLPRDAQHLADTHVGTQLPRDAQHLGDTHVGTQPRATQTIPPARRRHVLRRDGGKCVIPGCRHAVFVDIHHIDPKVEGGGNDSENLATLCAAHHRAVHSGRLTIEGDMSTGLVVRHADGRPYGLAPRPREVEERALVFQALKKLGFRESEARRGVERAETHVGTGVGIEALLRASLRVLTERSMAAPAR
jgi:5-methylcytosine-specific restriction endonuclease McrA